MNNNNLSNQQWTISHTRYVVWLAVLVALVVLFQLYGSYIKIGTTYLSLVLVPVVLGGILLGVMAGCVLGFIFSAVVIIMGLTGADAFTNILLINAPLRTIVIILLKGVLAGFVPALIYKVLSKKRETLSIFIAAIVAPIINTGIFVVGTLSMSGVLSNNFNLNGNSVLYFLVVVCAGINFIIELAINIVLAPAISRVVFVIRKR